MKRQFLFLLLLFPCITLLAQKNGIISGIITDASDGFTAPGATVKLDKFNRYTISNSEGYYEFLNVPEGDYEVSVFYIGYEEAKAPAKVTNKQNCVVHIKLRENSIELGQVTIMGDGLRGQAKALNQQKTNSNISNVISADQVGRFPDSNLGDALKRVPGITMQNDQGEARNIIIRGLSPELNSVTLNGSRIPSAEGDNRNVQMDLIPADMISTIEVNKTLTADMDGDAIGGSVNLKTRAATGGTRISATALGGYNPIRKSPTYSGSLFFAKRFFNEKLGVVLSASHLNKDYGSDNIEAKWEKDEKSGQIYANDMQIRRYDVQRIRNSFSAGLDYKFNENHKISADIIYNWRNDRENRYKLQYKDIEPESYNADNTIQSYTGVVRRETKGGIDNNKNKNTRLEDQRMQSYALQGEHLLTPKLDLDWNLSYARASEDRPNERYIEFQQKKVGMQLDLADTRKPFVETDNESNEQMKFKQLSENHNYTREEEYSAGFNFRTPLSAIQDQKGRLRFGMKGKMKDKKRDNIFYEYTPLEEIGNLTDVPVTYYSGKYFGPGSKYVQGDFASKSYLGNLDLNNPMLFAKEAIAEEYLPKNYTAKEKIGAGYVRWDQNISNNLMFIVGLRAEYTKIDYTGNMIPDINEATYEKVSKSNSYWNLLPSFNLRYTPVDNVVLRAAVTTALARPNYYSLVPYISVNPSDSDHILSAGNPTLKPTKSVNVDLMGEYYFASVGMISAGLFYKNLDNFIYKFKDTQYTQADFQHDFPGVANPIGAGQTWEMFQDRNGSKVNLWGAELAFQRKLDFLPTQFLKNFTIYLNYTYTYSKAKGVADEDGNERKNIKLPGTAPHMLNASLAWENTKFSARLSLNYTSDYLDVLGNEKFYDSYYDKQLFLDFNASYKFSSHLNVFVEANNLLNQPLRYYQGNKSLVQQLEYYKPTFTLGVKYNF